jgi:hypothetical protein
MSQQQQSQPASVPNVNEANVSQRRSSCASTELPVDNAVETGQQRYPVDDITQRTPWVLQTQGHNLHGWLRYCYANPTRRRLP